MKAENIMLAGMTGSAQTAAAGVQSNVRTVEQTRGNGPAEGSFDNALQTASNQEKDALQPQTVQAEKPEPVEVPAETVGQVQEGAVPAENQAEPELKAEVKPAAADETAAMLNQVVCPEAMLLALAGNLQPNVQPVTETVPLTETAPQLTQDLTGALQSLLPQTQEMQPQLQEMQPQLQELMPQLNTLESLLPSEASALNNETSLQSLVPQGGQTTEQRQQAQQLMELLAGRSTLQAPLTAETEQVQAEQLINNEPLQALVLNTPGLQTERPEPQTDEAKAEKEAGSIAELLGDTVLTVEKQDGPLRMQTSLREQAQNQSTPQQQTEGEIITQKLQTPGQAAFDSVSIAATDTATTSPEAQQAGAGMQQPLQSQPLAADTSVVPQQAEGRPQVDSSNVMEQIVRQARLIQAADGNEMVIRLEPEYLGELTMRIAVKGDGTVNATFLAENAQTRSILQGAMVELKQQLEAQGMRVDNVEVGSELTHDFFANSEAGQQGYPYQQSGSARSEAALRSAFEDDAEAVTEFVSTAVPTGTEVNNATDDGVDYRI